MVIIFQTGYKNDRGFESEADENNPNNVIITDVVQQKCNLSSVLVGVNGTFLFRMVASPDCTKLALNFHISSNGRYVHLCDFDPLTGIVTYDNSIDLNNANKASGMYMGFVFHKNYLYMGAGESKATPGGGDHYIYQYDLVNKAMLKSKKLTNSTKTMGWPGGDIKMGPDGKIYIIRQSFRHMGVINNPDSLLDASGNFDENGFLLTKNKGSYGLAISTGLTRPSN